MIMTRMCKQFCEIVRKSFRSKGGRWVETRSSQKIVKKPFWILSFCGHYMHIYQLSFLSLFFFLQPPLHSCVVVTGIIFFCTEAFTYIFSVPAQYGTDQNMSSCPAHKFSVFPADRKWKDRREFKFAHTSQVQRARKVHVLGATSTSWVPSWGHSIEVRIRKGIHMHMFNGLDNGGGDGGSTKGGTSNS
jgi:hypothetical protein